MSQENIDPESNMKEFLDFYNAVQSKRYFLSDPTSSSSSSSSSAKKLTGGKQLNKLENENNPRSASSELKLIRQLNKPTKRSPINTLGHNKNRDQDEENKPTVSERNWIPDQLRIKQMEREAVILNSSITSMIYEKTRHEKKLKKLTMSDFQHAKTQESLGKSKYMSCGCCLVRYLSVNLPFKVPKKAIMDVRKQWQQQKLQEFSAARSGKLDNNNSSATTATSFMSNMTSNTTSTYSSSSSSNNHKQQVSDIVFTDINGMTRRDACTLYDYQAICVFCAQFFHQPEAYRPSYAQAVAEEKMETFLEQQRLDELKWDPLTLLEADRKLQQLALDSSSSSSQSTSGNGCR